MDRIIEALTTTAKRVAAVGFLGPLADMVANNRISVVGLVVMGLSITAFVLLLAVACWLDKEERREDDK